MTTFFTVITGFILFGYWFLIAGITFRVLMKRRAVSSAMAWLLVIYIFPLIGLIAYFLFGELYLGKRRAERAKAMWPSTKNWLNELKNCNEILSTQNSELSTALFQLCELRQGISGTKDNHLKLLSTAQITLTHLLQDITQAQNNIEMVFYIWQPGGLVDEVVAELILAARRGVHCRLMLDSAGSRRFFRSASLKAMRDAGIEIVEALPVSPWRVSLRRIDLRQHRKIVLIDNRITYSGSMNMVDPVLFRGTAGIGQWIDLMARIEGPVTTVMGIVYAGDWEIETGHRILPLLPKCNNRPASKKPSNTIQVVASGPGAPEDIIHQALLTAVYSAREQLIMTTPYFIPSDDLLHAICTAAHRGVDVSIIIPYQNNSMLVGWASRAFFTELLEAGVKIYQFKGGFLHSKSVLIDNQLSLIGSINLDMRSLWINFEITLIIDDGVFGRDLAALQNDYISHSMLLEVQQWTQRPLWQRGIEHLFYFFSPLL